MRVSGHDESDSSKEERFGSLVGFQPFISSRPLIATSAHEEYCAGLIFQSRTLLRNPPISSMQRRIHKNLAMQNSNVDQFHRPQRSL